MERFIRVGVDLGKNYFHVRAIRPEGGEAVSRKLSRAKFRAFFAGIAPCRVGMEACGSAHHWGRELAAMGHEPALMPPAYTKPYVKRGKSDAADAAAAGEAMTRPGMRYVPVKSAGQQAVLMLHKSRELLVKQRTMSVNALRGHLAEFGVVAAKGIGRVGELLALALADAGLPAAAKAAAARIGEHIRGIGEAVEAMEADIAEAHAGSPASQLLDGVPGIGPLTASVIAASVPDPGAFRSGRDFAAWLGLTPKQNSTGGRQRLGAVSKQGNRHIRKMLVVGATSVLRVARRRKGALADWIAALRLRKPEKLVAVALANKLARACWAIMSTGEAFRADTYAKA